MYLFTLLLIHTIVFSKNKILRVSKKRASDISACICINCKWVDDCKTYHWIENMHEQCHISDEPNFDPDDPHIQAFVCTENSMMTIEYDIFACASFEEDTGKWLRMMPNATSIPT